MLNAVPNFNLNPCYSTTAIAQNPVTDIRMPKLPGSIMPQEEKTVTINGQTYPVEKVEDRGFLGIMPKTKEVVVIDGKQYDVKTVPDPRCCDKTKQVVIVDGKQYDVHDANSFEGILGGILM